MNREVVLVFGAIMILPNNHLWDCQLSSIQHWSISNCCNDKSKLKKPLSAKPIRSFFLKKVEISLHMSFICESFSQKKVLNDF